MPKTIRTTIILFVTGFLLVFFLRLGYGYLQSPDGVQIQSGRVGGTISQGWDFAAGLKNYASKKIGVLSMHSSGQSATPATTTDQKYEKVANIGLYTDKFDDDETRVRTLIKKSSALIQFEQRQGLKGRRLLRLAIGVNPAQFDEFVDEIQTYGKLTELTINKSDKTNEYRQLQAKRVSLEKARASLTELKQREGEIRDMIELERRILESEQEIQKLGVSLGDFDAENEFVTVKILLAEKKAAIRNVSFARRILVAFVFTAKYYTFLWLGLAAAIIAALAGVQLLRIFANLLPKETTSS